MKPPYLPLFLALATISAHAGSLSLDAHEVGTGSVTYTNWYDDWGGYNRDFYRSKRILVTVHDMSRKSSGFDLIVYFIARPAVPPNKIGMVTAYPFIYDRAETSQKLNGLLEVKGTFPSRTLAANTQNYPLIGEGYASGADMDGWIVIGKSQGFEFGVCASNQTLLEIAQGNPRQHESFAAMVDAYDKAHGPSKLNRPSETTTAAAPRQLTPATTAVAAAPDAATPALSPSATQFVTLTAPTEIAINYGKTTLPRGTRLEVISRDAKTITARYLGETIALPASLAEAK